MRHFYSCCLILSSCDSLYLGLSLRVMIFYLNSEIAGPCGSIKLINSRFWFNYYNRSTTAKSLNESDDFQESLILSKMTEGHAHAILQPICKLNSVMMETTKIVRPQLWSLKEPKWLIFYLWFYAVIWIWCDPTKFVKSNFFVDGWIEN